VGMRHNRKPLHHPKTKFCLCVVVRNVLCTSHVQCTLHLFLRSLVYAQLLHRPILAVDFITSNHLFVFCESSSGSDNVLQPTSPPFVASNLLLSSVQRPSTSSDSSELAQSCLSPPRNSLILNASYCFRC